MSPLALQVVGLALLLLLSGFFSGSETALMAVNRYRLSYLARRGDTRAAALRRLLATPDRLISTILLGNNFANTAGAALATAVAISFAGEQGVIVSTLVMTLLILIFCEIAPKTFAARFPERTSFLVARPIAAIVWVLHPLAHAAGAVANALLRPFGRPHPTHGRVSEEDIKGIIELGEEERVIAREKRRMLHGVFELTETTIEDIMIPRTQIKAVAVDADPAEVLDVIRRSGATRLPVYEGTLDEIVGVLHSKDTIRFWENPDEIELRDLVRKPFFVPETATLEHLLRLFKRRRQHLAVVIDEFGGVEGIVSLEDLLEEIVGDIEDEHDEPGPPQVLELGDGALLVDGTCPLSLLQRRYGLQFDPVESSTLAGFLMELTGRIPAPGERIDHRGFAFVIQRARRHRIELVRVERADAEGGPTASEGAPDQAEPAGGSRSSSPAGPS